MLHNYSIFVIDPPWPKKKGGLRKVAPNQTRKLDYETMDVRSIFGLLDREIFPTAYDTHMVFLWGIDQYLHEGEVQMSYRGYKLHARMIWDKENGVAPGFTIRYSHEYISWFYYPKMIPVDKDYRGKYSSVINERSREHSRKPDRLYNMIDNLYPDQTKLDVFSRERRPGLHSWGNQTDYFTGR